MGRGPPRLRAADEAGLCRPRHRCRAAGDHPQPVRDPEGGQDVEAGGPLRHPRGVDLELATTHNKTNPVYYVQYAHARLCGIERTAAGRELPEVADPDALEHPWELDLARQLAHWPDAVAEAARLMEPHRVPYFIYELADRVSTFYEAGNDNGDFRVVVDDPRLTRARLELARAARATLRSGLDLVGVSAPERMERTLED
ncbi:MAG: hypothetical protein E6I85_07115 [Chloroflexi bacterium]|nr:MAG: hypothetical protein E6I85_07115 [Chloroflexota bacterium]